MAEKKEITVAEAGRRGGLKTAERGPEFFREIGRKGGLRTKELYAVALKEFGRRGGRPRRPNLSNMGGKLPEDKGG
jgi:general stress protein YciG